MQRIFRGGLPIVLGVGLLGVCPLAASAQSYFNNQSAFQTAAGGTGALTVFGFNGVTETDGKSAVDPTIIPSYSSLGVDFLPFTGTNFYPVISRNQQFQISLPNQDGLLQNTTATAPVTNPDARAIRFSFNRPENAVGVFFNGPLNGGDGGFIRAFDTGGSLVAQTPVSAAGGFVGLTSPVQIVRVDIVNTFNSDITFGIFNLQFGNSAAAGAAAPEPPSLVLLLCAGSVAAAAWFLRQRRSSTTPCLIPLRKR